jgi:esterase/lipase
MKKALKYLGFILIAGVVLFAIGPKPQTNTTITFGALNLEISNLDNYLQDSEGNVKNLVEGAEKEIIWADPTAQSQTDIALVYIHGFSATKHETRPVTDKIAEVLGANIYYARLKGHGRDGSGMAEADLQDWANDYAEAITIGEMIGKKIIVLSASTGGSLTTWGLSNPELSKNIAGVVLISPNYELHGISTSLANIPWAETILPLVAGQERSWEPLNEAHGKWWTTSYPSKAIFPMTALLKVLKSVDKSQITTPAFFIYSPNDKVIIPEEVAKVAAEWGGPTKVLKIEETSDPYSHVITGDILSPENTNRVTYEIIAWLMQNEKLGLPELFRGSGNEL